MLFGQSDRLNTLEKDIDNQSQNAVIEGRSLWALAWQRLKSNRAAMVSAVLLLVIVVMVIFGPMLSPHEYDQTVLEGRYGSVDFVSAHYFGQDALGRDLFVRVLEGGRISLMVGVVAALVSLIIGVSYGAIAGYMGGTVDSVMMRIVDVLYGLPFMFFVIMLMAFFERNIFLIFFAIGAVNWLDMARIVRGQTMTLRNTDYVEAARAVGISTPRIIFRHIVPNLLGIVMVYITLTIPQVILAESFLSFLGLGVQEPSTSWGALVNEGRQAMQIAPWILIIPAAFLTVTLFCFNFIGDGLRDALDPKDR